MSNIRETGVDHTGFFCGMAISIYMAIFGPYIWPYTIYLAIYHIFGCIPYIRVLNHILGNYLAYFFHIFSAMKASDCKY